MIFLRTAAQFARSRNDTSDESLSRSARLRVALVCIGIEISALPTSFAQPTTGSGASPQGVFLHLQNWQVCFTREPPKDPAAALAACDRLDASPDLLPTNMQPIGHERLQRRRRIISEGLNRPDKPSSRELQTNEK